MKIFEQVIPSLYRITAMIVLPLFALMLVVSLPLLGCSQNRAPTESSPVVPIVLGRSVVPLNGPWKFHLGDDSHWSESDFDDCDWETVDLTPEPGAHDGDVGLSGYVPGWTAMGHTGYSGYAWYRIHLRVSGAGDGSLAIAGPAAADDAYQLYFNGRLLGGIGDFSRESSVVYSIQPRIFTLPRIDAADASD